MQNLSHNSRDAQLMAHQEPVTAPHQPCAKPHAAIAQGVPQFIVSRAACADDGEYHLRVALAHLALAKSFIPVSDPDMLDALAAHVRCVAEDLMDALYLAHLQHEPTLF